MPKVTYVCRKDKKGEPRMVRLDERMVYRKDETADSFEKRILDSYYQKECEQGSRFRSGYDKNTIKEAWTR